ncbi:hypothetical protein [Sphingomonas sp. 28-62-11]|uniref:hypothetical protein n=1 Tax=Sphingomonas sp. 28-62-11 TaxID=1970432 RepID=UPI000BC3983D|nr:MAG: hypothetical protein B7Y49_06235 [Sphingomonas sp. 28-62-11]
MTLRLAILFSAVTFLPAVNQQQQPISVKVERPIGVEASRFVRYVQGGGKLAKSAHDILILGNVLSVRQGTPTDTIILSSDSSSDHLKAEVQHDWRLQRGKLVSIACRQVNETGKLVVVSNCRFVIAA